MVDLCSGNIQVSKEKLSKVDTVKNLAKSLEYGKCLETAKEATSLEYGKCLEAAKEAKSLEYWKCPKDFIVSGLFPYSKDFTVFPVCRHFPYSKNFAVFLFLDTFGPKCTCEKCTIPTIVLETVTNLIALLPQTVAFNSLPLPAWWRIETTIISHHLLLWADIRFLSFCSCRSFSSSISSSRLLFSPSLTPLVSVFIFSVAERRGELFESLWALATLRVCFSLKRRERIVWKMSNVGFLQT